MPIKNLTDNVIPRFPRLGKLRKGGESVEKTNEQGKKYNTYGPDLNHFRFTSDNPAVVQAFHDAYGTAPVSLNVYLPYPSVEENFSTWKEQWSAGGLVHRCDGETCQIWRTPQGTYSQDPKPCPGGCDEVGRLTVIIPELWKAGFIGYVTMETHSNHDLRNITATLLAVKKDRDFQGNQRGLEGIEFVLRRRAERISTPDDKNKGKRITREKWLVSLEPVASYAALYLNAVNSSMLAIEAPSNVDPATGEVLDSEPDGVTEGEFTEQPKPAQATNGKRDDESGLPFANTKRAAVDWAMQHAPGVWPTDKGFIVRKVVERSFDNCMSTSGLTGDALGHAWIVKVNGKIADSQKPVLHPVIDPPTDEDVIDTDGWQDVDSHGHDAEAAQF
jgi:hypothetical protein